MNIKLTATDRQVDRKLELELTVQERYSCLTDTARLGTTQVNSLS